MNLTAITPILNVTDIGASIAWFEQLGWTRCWTYNDGGLIKGAADRDANGPANFAAVGSGECEIFLCRGAQGSRGKPPDMTLISKLPPGVSPDDNTPGVWLSWWVKTPAEVDAAHQLAVQHRFTVIWPPTNEPWGVRECRIVHPDGHTFRISAPLHAGGCGY